MRRFFSILFWGIVVVVGVPVVGIVFKLALSSFTNSAPPSGSANQIDVKQLTPSSLMPDGELARMYNVFSDSTALQRDEKERQLKGVVVQWRLPVYDVSDGPSPYFRVQTSSGNATVGTFCYVIPQNEEERRFLALLKSGDYITCKGVIKGISMLSIEIKPAAVVLR